MSSTRWLVLLGLLGCSASTTYSLAPQPSSRAAVGQVQVKEDKNANNKVTVTVDHMPVPQNIDPALSTYVVWAQPTGRPPQPLGSLNVGSERRGKLDAVTPFDVFDVIVTAEASAAPTAPSDHVILRGRIDVNHKG
jgi:hypothetical protein